jgi:hypothetical protein
MGLNAFSVDGRVRGLSLVGWLIGGLQVPPVQL